MDYSHTLHASITNEYNTKNILYEIWFTIAEKLLTKIIEETQLSDEQADALRTAMLRPNDFDIDIV
jgi:hypothetical protein